MSTGQRDLTDLPGADLVLRGLEDSAHARPTPEAALVEIARTRLVALGLVLGPASPSAGDAELRLYERLAERHSERDPYLVYGAWLDQLVSFLAALGQRRERSGE